MFLNVSITIKDIQVQNKGTFGREANIISTDTSSTYTASFLKDSLLIIYISLHEQLILHLYNKW